MSSNPAKVESPLNIILLLGDGMGVSQLTTSFVFDEKPSNFERFQNIGLHQPIPEGEEKITDSAASATAIGSGHSTHNGALGVDENGIPVQSILEMGKDNGKSVGLIASSSITHATPAAFYAHVGHRDSAELIAKQFVNSNIDFVAAGGYRYFCQRSDGCNYLDTLKARGVIVDTTGLMHGLSIQKPYTFLSATDSLLSMRNGRGNFLPEATAIALDYLSQNEDKGFFLMVEGSQIDWACHQNDPQRVIDEVRDFDNAIGVALDYAIKDGKTLVIVTGDHETGGFALSARMVGDKADYRHVEPTFSTGHHTASLIPVFAFGPSSELFKGIYKNTSIHFKMKEAFGF